MVVLGTWWWWWWSIGRRSSVTKSVEPVCDLLISGATVPAYKLPLSHQHHPPRHLSPFEAIPKSAGFCNSPTSSTSLLPPPSLPLMLASTPLQSDNQLWRFSPGFRPTIGCFSTRGKNAPCPPHDRPRPGRHCPGRLGLSKLENCSPEEVQLCVLLLLAISPPRNVGGRLVEVGS